MLYIESVSLRCLDYILSYLFSKLSFQNKLSQNDHSHLDTLYQELFCTSCMFQFAEIKQKMDFIFNSIATRWVYIIILYFIVFLYTFPSAGLYIIQFNNHKIQSILQDQDIRSQYNQ